MTWVLQQLPNLISIVGACCFIAASAIQIARTM